MLLLIHVRANVVRRVQVGCFGQSPKARLRNPELAVQDGYSRITRLGFDSVVLMGSSQRAQRLEPRNVL